MTKNIDKDELQIAKDMLSENISTESVRAFLEQRTKVNLTGDQIRRLKVHVRDRHLVALDGSDQPTTAADRLLKQLEQSETASWVALFAEYDTDLVTIPKISARSQKKNRPRSTKHTLAQKAKSTRLPMWKKSNLAT